MKEQVEIVMHRRQMIVVGVIQKMKQIEVVKKLRKELTQFQIKTQKLQK